MRKNLVRILIVAVVGGLAFLFSYFGLGGWGGGRGGGSGGGGGKGGPGPASTAQPQPDSPQTPQPQTLPAVTRRPLEIVIEDHLYLLQGKQVSLEDIARLIPTIPAGPGPAVTVIRQPSSRAAAEVALRRKLEDLKASSSWSPPL